MPGLVSLRGIDTLAWPSDRRDLQFGTDPAAADFRQPEIENLGVPALGHKNIRGLDVAMDDALRVRRIERVGDCRCQSSIGSSSSGRPAIVCFSVLPSRYSMAMNACRRPRQCRRSCRCSDGSAQKRLSPRGETVRAPD